MKKLLVVAIVLISTVGCYKVPLSNPRQMAKEIVTKKYELQPFKAIVLNNNVTIELINGSYAAIVTSTEDDFYDYRFKVQDHVLHIAAPISDNITIKIATPGLNKIIVAGNATVNAKDFKANGLTVSANNNGTINLEGQYDIAKIYQRGNGRINISWIDGEKVYIDNDAKGPLYLAGSVDNIIAKLSGHALLDARYLRTRNASIITTDNAHADVLVLNTLEAYAIENSSIYYHKRPKQLTTVTKESGNVLYLDWIY